MKTAWLLYIKENSISLINIFIKILMKVSFRNYTPAKPDDNMIVINRNKSGWNDLQHTFSGAASMIIVYLRRKVRWSAPRACDLVLNGLAEAHTWRHGGVAVTSTLETRSRGQRPRPPLHNQHQCPWEPSQTALCRKTIKLR